VTYLGASVAYLWSLVQTWTTRANQAWGDSQVWNSGVSYRTQRDQNAADRDTWAGRANQAWGATRVWSSGQSFETDAVQRGAAAYDGGAWGSGNLWSTDAHSDPNVWTNQYNAGYNAGYGAGAASKTTDGQSVGMTAFSGANNSTGWVAVATLVAPRSGFGQAGGWCGGQRRDTTAGDYTAYARIRNVSTGAVLFDGQANGWRTLCDVDIPEPIVAMYQGAFVAGQTYGFDVIITSQPSGKAVNLGSGGFYLTVGSQ